MPADMPAEASASSASATASRPSHAPVGWWASFFSVVGLTSLGISQPVFNLVGADPSFFVAHQSETNDIIAFGLAVLVIPALVALALVGVSRVFGRTPFSVVSSGVVGLLGGYLIATMFKRPVTWGTATLVALVVVLAALIGTAFYRSDAFRSGLRLIGYLAPVTLLWFLFGGPVSSLVGASDATAVGQGATEDYPLVIVVFDELPAASLMTVEETIDPVQVPNFARLAKMSTWYRETATVSSRTTWAVPAISTGSFPTGRETPPDSSAYPNNVFTYLSPSHVLDADEFLTRLCPRKLCEEGTDDQIEASLLYTDGLVAAGHALLPGPFAERNLAPLGDQWAGFTKSNDNLFDAAEDADATGVSGEETVAERMAADSANDQAARFRAFAKRAAARVEPTVSYMHVALPHVPWKYLPDGRQYNGDGVPGLAPEGWGNEKSIIDNGAFRHLLQVEFVDSLLGELLDELEASPNFDETMLIVTSDHGAAFRPELPRRSPTKRTVGELAHVPLFVKYPGQTVGELSDRRSATIDILPTIADVLGVELGSEVDGNYLPPNIDGVSLLEPTPADRPLAVWGKGNRVIVGPRIVDGSARTRKSLNRAVPDGQLASDSFLYLNGRNDFEPRSLSTLPLGGEIEITNQDQYLGLRPDTPLIPARLFGHVRGAVSGGDVVIMVNGVAAGAAPVAENRRLTVMLDPLVLDAASADGITFTAAHSTPDGWVQLGIRDRPELSLAFDESGALSSVESDGRVWDTPNETAQGNIDQVPDESGSSSGRVFGWAADPGLDELPVEVLLFEGAEVVGRPNQIIPRADVADIYGNDEFVDAGWSFLFTSERIVENLFVVVLYRDNSFDVLTQ